jgi:deoxycytidylate deaminase
VTKFRIIANGKEHTTGDPNCPACYQYDPQGRWPRPHNHQGCAKRLHAEMDADIGAPNVAGATMRFYCEACGSTMY